MIPYGRNKLAPPVRRGPPDLEAAAAEFARRTEEARRNTPGGVLFADEVQAIRKSVERSHGLDAGALTMHRHADSGTSDPA